MLSAAKDREVVNSLPWMLKVTLSFVTSVMTAKASVSKVSNDSRIGGLLLLLLLLLLLSCRAGGVQLLLKST